MLFWFPTYNRHDCSPIKTKELTKFRYYHSENYAAYDKIQYTVDLAECPVCGKTYEYNQRDDRVIGRISYSEVSDLKGKL